MGGRLVRQLDRPKLSRTDDEPLRPLLVEVLGFGERDGVRGAIDGFGQPLLPLCHLAVKPDDHVVVEDPPVDGDRAKVRPVDPGLHPAPHPPRPTTASEPPRTDFPEPVSARGSLERAPHGSGSRCSGQLPTGLSTVGSNGGEGQTCIQCWSEADCWSFDQECCSVWWLRRLRRRVMGRGVRAWHAGAVPTTLYATLAPEQIRYCAAHCAAKVAILEDRDLAKRWQELREGLPALRQVVVLEGAADLTRWERASPTTTCCTSGQRSTGSCTCPMVARACPICRWRTSPSGGRRSIAPLWKHGQVHSARSRRMSSPRCSTHGRWRSSASRGCGRRSGQV